MSLVTKRYFKWYATFLKTTEVNFDTVSLQPDEKQNDTQKPASSRMNQQRLFQLS